MVELSQDEKDRVRAELEYRFAVTGELRASSGIWQKIFNALSHPIIVTVLGGALIAWGGVFLQDRYAETQTENAHVRQIQDKKLSIVANLPVQLYKDLALIQNRSYLRFDLEQWKRNRTYVAYLGRSRKEVMALYDKLAEEFIKSPRQAPLLSEVRAWFCDSGVLTSAGELDKQIRNFAEKKASQLTQKDIQEFGLAAEKRLDDLVALMVIEVKNPVAPKCAAELRPKTN